MKSRRQITDTIKDAKDDTSRLLVILEVLLDIRDLLTHGRSIGSFPKSATPPEVKL